MPAGTALLGDVGTPALVAQLLSAAAVDAAVTTAGAWFAKDEGDGTTARVLLPGSLDGSGVSSSAAADPKQPRRYKLEVGWAAAAAVMSCFLSVLC